MTARSVAPPNITLHRTTLFMMGIIALECAEFAPCTRVMHSITREGRFARSIEGVFAEQLVRAYPERYRWLRDWLQHRGDGAVVTILEEREWELLQPDALRIVNVACRDLGCASLSAADSLLHLSHAEAAAALWRAGARGRGGEGSVSPR